MTVGLKVHGITTEIGPGDLLHAFFSTVSANLESGSWGARFPVLLGELYQGSLAAERAAQALEELALVSAELRALPLSRLVWDVERPEVAKPAAYTGNPKARDLAAFFLTVTGRNLLEAIQENIEALQLVGGELKVVSYNSIGDLVGQ